MKVCDWAGIDLATVGSAVRLTTDFAMEPWPQGYKTFFMLNSAEHEIFHADKS